MNNSKRNTKVKTLAIVYYITQLVALYIEPGLMEI